MDFIPLERSDTWLHRRGSQCHWAHCPSLTWQRPRAVSVDWVCFWPWRNYHIASIHYQVFYSPPLFPLSLYLQFKTTESDSPAALTERSDCIHTGWNKTMQVLFSFYLVCLMSKEAWGSRCEEFFCCLLFYQGPFLKLQWLSESPDTKPVLN